MSDDNNGPGRRPAKDVKGLLRFCMEATRSEDAQGTTIVEPMTEERKKWLEEAFTQMTVSPVERMNICIKVIEEAEKDTEEGTAQQVKALEELQEWADDMDIAADFVKIRGLRIIPNLLSSEVSALRWGGLELIANLVQNNPVTQTAVLCLQLLPVILAMADTDDHPRVRVKALLAVSCLVRSNTEAQMKLRACDGLSVLVRALDSEEEKIRVKSAFLMSALCSTEPAFKEVLLEKGAVTQIIQQLKSGLQSAGDEYLMSALLAIVTQHAAARELCLRDDLDLKTFLCQRIRELQGVEERQEERESADQLLRVLNSPPPDAPPQTSSSTNMSLMIA